MNESEAITMTEIINRAAADSNFFAALSADCATTAAGLGRPIQLPAIKELLGASGVSDAELAELLVAQVRRT